MQSDVNFHVKRSLNVATNARESVVNADRVAYTIPVKKIATALYSVDTHALRSVLKTAPRVEKVAHFPALMVPADTSVPVLANHVLTDASGNVPTTNAHETVENCVTDHDVINLAPKLFDASIPALVSVENRAQRPAKYVIKRSGKILYLQFLAPKMIPKQDLFNLTVVTSLRYLQWIVG